MKNVAIAAKRRRGEWATALVVDNVFKNAETGTDLATLITEHITALLEDSDFSDGQEVLVNLIFPEIPGNNNNDRVND